MNPLTRSEATSHGLRARHRPSAVGRTGSRVLVLGLLLLPALFVSTALCAQQGITLSGLGGGSFSEAELSRGPTLVVVWASWSPRGKDIVPRVNALHRKWGSKCRVVAVNFQEDRTTIDEFLSGQNLQVPVLLDEDGAFAKKYAVTSLPGLLVFQDGQKAFGGRLPEEPDRVLSEIFP